MKEYRTGIIGFGFMGKVHAYGHLNLPLYYDPVPLHAPITHVCDSIASVAQKGAAMLGAAHAVTDYRQITENPDIGIVHICTPNFLHKDALLSAMRHGKHIYCDKPLVATVAEAEEIEAALPSYTGTAQLALQSRFFPATLRARQLIDEGVLGTPLQFRCSYLHAGSANPKAPLKWKLSAAAGGGVIADLASHVIDLISFLLGDYARVNAATQIAYPERPAADDPTKMVKVEAEDSVIMMVRMGNGAVGTIEASKLATGTEDELRFEVHGSAGALRFNTMDAHHLDVYDAGVPDQPMGGRRGWTRVDTGQRYPKPAAVFPGPKFTIGWIRGHLAALANFLQSVADGKPAEPGLRQGILIQRIMERVRQSATGGVWVDV